MATVLFSYYTAYINAVDTQTVTARDSTFVWTPPTFTTYFNTGNPYISSGSRQLGRAQFIIPTPTGRTNTTSLSANASAVTAEGSWSGAVSFTLGSKTFTTSNFFNSNNPTVRTLNAKVVIPSYTSLTLNLDDGTGSIIAHTTSDQTLTNVNITLDAPPTFDNTALTFDTPYVYTGLTNASVTVSNLSAKYGGTITDVTLTIGTQTDSATGDGTLSVLLDTVGTFTPTITATDSRGQTTTVTLDPIEVKGYTAPAVTFTADRTLQTGVEDDEGGYATVDATFTYTDVVADLVAPSVVLTDENGTQTIPTVTWYKTRATDGTLSSPFTDWTTVAYGDTVYGLIPGLSTQYSYQVSIRPRDTQGTGTAIIQTIAPAFYTVDFLAGGHGIAFGQPASQEGFYCNMEAHFTDNNSVMRALFDFIHPVGSYYETSDTAFDPNVTWGGTWEQVESGRFLQATTDTSKVGDTVNAGLPNITGSVQPGHGKSVWVETVGGSGAFYNYSYATNCGVLSYSSTAGGNNSIAFDASRSNSIYGNSTTVQPPSILVFIWHRTA